VHTGQAIVEPQPLLTGPQRVTPPEPAQATGSVNGTHALGPASLKAVPPSDRVMMLLAPHWLGTPLPPHVSPAGQAAPASPVGLHARRLPQPSAITPQFIAPPSGSAHAWLVVKGTHAAVPPHWFGVPPPPHVCGALHVTQGVATTPPHPSACWPQRAEMLGSAHVLGTHATAPPHWLGTPPPPQESPPEHVPHTAVRPPQPSATCPHVAPAWVQVRGVHAGPAPSPPTVASGLRLVFVVAS
jgi:hypothetical protein